MKAVATVSILAIVGLIIFLMIQQRAQEKLRAENDLLTQQLAQLQTDDENFSNQLAQTKNSQSLADDKMNELLKLRGEVGVLRNQLNQAQRASAQNQQAAHASAQQTSSIQLSPDEQFELQSYHVSKNLKQIGLAMRIYAGDHQNQYATNFDQLIEMLNPNTNMVSDFEFVNAGVVNDTMPEVIMFRERVPRVDSSGYWQRLYGLADGSVQTVWGGTQGDTKEFDNFEKQHSPPSPTVSPSQ